MLFTSVHGTVLGVLVCACGSLFSNCRAQRSITVSKNGEVFHLSSFSEIQRCLFCAYNGLVAFVGRYILYTYIHICEVVLQDKRQ